MGYGVIPFTVLVCFVLTLRFNKMEEQERWKRIEACCRSKTAMKQYRAMHFLSMLHDSVNGSTTPGQFALQRQNSTQSRDSEKPVSERAEVMALWPAAGLLGACEVQD